MANGTDKVKALAPKVTIDGKVWLKEDKTIGSAYVGIVQNLASSDRIGVYKHGGDPNGEITAESHDAQRNKWDAVNDPGRGRGQDGGRRPFPPFYWPPGQHRRRRTSRATPAPVSRLGTPWDQPEFSLPVQKAPAA